MPALMRWAPALLAVLWVTPTLQAQTLAAADFSNGISDFSITGTNPTFRLFAPFSNDGTVSAQDGSLLLNSVPFTQDTISIPGVSPTLDHVKYMAFLAPEFPTNDDQDIVCKLRARGWAQNTQDHPFGSTVNASDPRLATMGSINGDLSASLIADFIISNTTVYALYERLPFARTPSNQYAAFTYMVPVKQRQPSDIHDLAVRFSTAKGTLTWYIDGQQVLYVDRIGMGISVNYRVNFQGGQEEIIKVNQISCGFATLSLMDFYPACTDATGCPTDMSSALHKGLVQLEPYTSYQDPRQCRPASFLFPPRATPGMQRADLAKVTKSRRLFGQGSVAQVYKIEALAVSPAEATPL